MSVVQIFRDLNQWKIWVLLLALVGSGLVFWYGKCHQTYVADISLIYTNDGAAEGLNPDGSVRDVEEICSAAVLNRVISDLGLTDTADSIRAMCTVSQVLSPEEQTRKDAILGAGGAYEAVPTEYLIQITVGGDKDGVYARRVLEAMVENYIALYGERHIGQLSPPYSETVEESGTSDFLRSAELLEHSAAELLNWLEGWKDVDFRSSATGYSFGDLLEAYTWIRDHELPALYAMILEGHFTKDRDTLLSSYAERIEQDGLTIAALNEEVVHLRELLDGYTSGPLIERYVDLLNQISEFQADQEWAEYIYSIYASNEELNGETAVTEGELQNKINGLAERMEEYQTLVEASAREYSAYLTAQSISVPRGVHVEGGLNLPLYAALAAAALLLLGCMGAVALGRLTELAVSLRDIDPETGLPNRARCERVIDHLSREVLEDSFTFVVIRLDGQAGPGGAVLSDFGRMLNDAAQGYGFIGHHGGGRFFGFFENCPVDKAELFRAMLQERMEAYHWGHSECRLHFDMAVSESGTEGIYEIRALMGTAFSKLGYEYARL